MKSLVLALLCFSLSGTGKTFHSREEALSIAYGEAEVVRTPHYWTKQERAKISALAGIDKASGTHAEYQSTTKSGKVVAGRSVWFDTRKIRSKPQTIMLMIDAEQRVEEIVVCGFDEPLEYKPVDRWYQQFVGKRLDGNLQLKKSIHGVSGATLTSRATTAAVREMLAAHAVAHPSKVKKKKSVKK